MRKTFVVESSQVNPPKDPAMEEPKKPLINNSVFVMFVIFLLGLIAGGIMGVNIQLQDLRDMYKKTHMTPESNR